MQRFSLHLPKYRLDLEYKLVKRRRTYLSEPLIPQRSLLGKKYRVGNIAHKFFRHIFEHKKIKKILGTNIAFALIATSFLPVSAVDFGQESENIVFSEKNVPLHTQKALVSPVEKIVLTQGFAFYHPGLDLDGITGDTIKPIKKGVVLNISYSKFAYGNSIIIDHGEGLTSLYAHLSKIDVSEGQTVTTDTKIGEMGATGRSFGDHLHLEIRDHGKAINPLTVIPKQ